MQTRQAPSAAAVVTHRVADFTAWKQVFDGDADRRKAAGITGHHINRSVEDPNVLSIYLPASSADSLQSFLGDSALEAKMQEAGVEGRPELTLMDPQEDQTIKDRDLPGAIIRHEVADYAAWKAAFDRHDATRRSVGIVGYAVNLSVENPNLVIVYIQADSADALRAFTQSEDLKNVMKDAGVQGVPQISFVDGTEWGLY